MLTIPSSGATKTAPVFRTLATGFPGLAVLQPRAMADARGMFVKIFHAEAFSEAGIPFEPREGFYSVSAKNVLRGMHFQRPPAALAKLVYCLGGRVLDVVLDLRRGSPGFGKTFSRELSWEEPELLYVPPGFAHGFLALEDNSVMAYLTDHVYAPALDGGIAWDSFDFPWPVTEPVLSERDRRFPRLTELPSPF